MWAWTEVCRSSEPTLPAALWALPPNKGICIAGIHTTFTLHSTVLTFSLVIQFTIFEWLSEHTKPLLKKTLLRYDRCIINYTYWTCTTWQILTFIRTREIYIHRNQDDEHIFFSPAKRVFVLLCHFSLLRLLPPFPRQPLLCFLSLHMSLRLLKLQQSSIYSLAWLISLRTTVLRFMCAIECHLC